MKKKSLAKVLFLQIVALYTLSLVVFGIILVEQKHASYRAEAEVARQSFLEAQKDILKHEVAEAGDRVAEARKNAEDAMVGTLRRRSADAARLADSLARRWPRPSADGLGSALAEGLRHDRMLDGHGAFFWLTAEGGAVLPVPAEDGQAAFSLPGDKEAAGAFLEAARAFVAGGGEGEYRFTPPSGKAAVAAYLRRAAVPGLVVGAAGDLAKVEDTARQNALEQLSRTVFGHGGCLFTGDLAGTFLMCSAKGMDILDAHSRDGAAAVQELADLAKAGGGFLTFAPPEAGQGAPGPKKLLYVARIGDFDWYVAAGVRLDRLDDLLAANAMKLKREFWREALAVGLVLAGMFLVHLWFVLRLRNRLGGSLSSFEAAFRAGADRFVPVDRQAVAYRELDLVAESANRMIEHRRLAEAALRESEARYRNLFQDAAVGILMSDADCNIVGGNRRAAELLGYTPEEMGRLTGSDLVHPEDVAKIPLRQPGTAADLAALPSLERRMRRKDGTYLPVEVILSPVDRQGTHLVMFQDISQRKAAEADIRARLKEKELLLREIHHRVKNNLQIISSLLYLQSEQSEGAAAQDLFMESRGRISSMALVHEELYGSEDLSRVSLGEYVEKLVPRLLTAYGGKGRIAGEVAAEDVAVSIEQAIPFGLIVNELVTNALKHAFPGQETGKILVELYLKANRIEFLVSDDGVGLPEGFAMERTRTLGMQLVLGLTKQLDGDILVESGKGAAFRLSFPIKETGGDAAGESDDRRG